MAAPMRLTRRGKNVLAKGLTGSEIKFTRVGIGAGEFDYETESVYELSALKDLRMWLPLTSLKVEGDGTAYIEAFLSNAELTDGFACREHGLFALDPDSGEEILYSYRNVGEEYDFIPSNSGSAIKTLYIENVIEIQDAANVTAVLEMSVAYINRGDFEAHVLDAHAHPNMANVYNSVANAAEIWAADNDNHLHKISVENLREALAIDPPAVETRQDIISKSRDELGLNANLLMIEDFQGGDEVTDYFKSRVTSAAEGGALIAVADVKDLKTGAVYTISDNVNSELVQIKSVRRNASGYHCELVNRLENAYNYDATFLYKTTRAGAAKKSVTWRNIAFAGVSANIARVIELDNCYAIEGDGAILDNALTLA